MEQMISRPARTVLLKERERLRIEVERITLAIETLDLLLGDHKGVPEKSKPKPEKTKTKTAKTAAVRDPRPVGHRGGRRPRFDWDKGRQLWDKGKTMQEIADAFGCTTHAVKNAIRRYDWPRRPSGGSRIKLAGRKEIPLTRCPNCNAMTTLDPCEKCHQKLPSAAIGKLQ